MRVLTFLLQFTGLLRHTDKFVFAVKCNIPDVGTLFTLLLMNFAISLQFIIAIYLISLLAKQEAPVGSTFTSPHVFIERCLRTEIILHSQPHFWSIPRNSVFSMLVSSTSILFWFSFFSVQEALVELCFHFPIHSLGVILKHRDKLIFTVSFKFLGVESMLISCYFSLVSSSQLFVLRPFSRNKRQFFSSIFIRN
jgi:hypothetical protein